MFQIVINVSYRHRSKKVNAMDADMLVVGLAGMPGSGKSLVVEIARELGYAVVVMGDVIREETVKRGLELTPHNVGKVMLQLRAESGNTVVAQKCISKIQKQQSGKVIVDGLRSLFEVDAFKELSPSSPLPQCTLLQKRGLTAFSAAAEATTPMHGKSSMKGTCESSASGWAT